MEFTTNTHFTREETIICRANNRILIDMANAKEF